ncbi:MAG: MmcQ/YjbR family DNA-binding protein, partial [Rhodospirillales bacterium]|nr:MmcQ/YjbR family DNA-binding protein [Rhodospirillales bacterium]
YLASRGMKWIQHYAEPGLSVAELKGYLETSHYLASRNLTKKVRLDLNID